MALKFQYNKNAMLELQKQMKIRLRAVPILKNKEAALRVEVKRARREAERIEDALQARIRELEHAAALWPEWNPDLLRIRGLRLKDRKIAGIAVPELEAVEFEEAEFPLFDTPHWFADGRALLKELATRKMEKRVCLQRAEVLYAARKKTTQKLNLYEKVQIPEFEQALMKIKRFLENEENLSKAAQKIVKKRIEEQASTEL
jgi:V/A-type H+-transporting ATPase subunit D